MKSSSALLVALIALLALPAGASATSTASLDGRTLTITGSSGPDFVSVNYRDYGGPPGVIVADSSGGITPGANCQQEGANEVRCPTAMPANGNLITSTVNLGDGDDDYAVYLNGIADTVEGGNGDDELDGRVAGEIGGVMATDIINGGEGNDELGAGSGPGTTCNGGGGDDRITCFYVTTGVTVNGGPGRDTVQGGDGPDKINGDGGNDPSLQGLKGNDIIHGGDGDDGNQGPSDLIAGGEGADEIYGDAGVDRVVEDRNQDRKQFWSLDDQPNDGADLDDTGGADEGDNIHSDVENVSGGFDDDTIVGSAANNTLHGGTLGNDTISGLGGDDTIFTGISGDQDSADGGDGNDKVQGNGTLRGGAGNDTVDGQGGNDLIEPGPGIDTVSADDGNDVVRAVDGEVDTIGCGIGADVAEVDSSDVVNKDSGDLCETTTVTQAPAPGGGGAGPGGAGPGGGSGPGQNPTGNPNATAIQLILGRSGTLRGGVAAFAVTAPGPGVIVGQVDAVGGRARAAQRRRARLGTIRKVVSKAGRVTLRIRLKPRTKAHRRLLKRKRVTVKLTTRFTAAGSDDPAKVQTRKVVLKRR